MLLDKGKFNRLLYQSGAEGWNGFLTPAKPLRDTGSWSLCIVLMIILFPARCMAPGPPVGTSQLTAALKHSQGFVVLCHCICPGVLANTSPPWSHHAVSVAATLLQLINNQLISSKDVASANGLCVLGLIRLIVGVDALIRPSPLCFNNF